MSDELKDFSDKLNNIQINIEVIKEKIDCIVDHEKRIRRIESFMQRIIGTLIFLSFGVGSIITFLLQK
jgi:hypothetical protein